MRFRIVAIHTHQAEEAGITFTCLRRATPSEAGLHIAWEVYRGQELLKADCRTLNEAKTLCRTTAANGSH
jgi:hypothetical protein